LTGGRPALTDLKDEEPEEQYFSVLPRFQWGDYETISYCWESETRDRKIVLDGTLFDVPRNLEALLQRLRTLPDTKAGMKFWVDALCIDQSSVVEKNHQVKLMQTIYARAFSLIVWLGSDADESDQVVDFISSITLFTLREEAQWEKSGCGSTFQEWEKSEHVNDLRKSWAEMPWEPLLSFLSRNYWHRLWIILESALNHSMTLFLCGKRQLSRSMILRACDFCMRHSEALDQITPKSLKIVPASPGYTYGSIWPIDCLITMSDQARVGDNIDTVLDLGRQASVKHPEDKIYGLLGLLPVPLTKEITPDYTLSKETVYSQFARTMLEACHRLDPIFSWCSVEVDSPMPSWVPDWTTLFNRNHIQ
jgi:hypothetical protein